MTKRLIGKKLSETTAGERQELADFIDKVEIPPEFNQGMKRLQKKHGEVVFMLAMFVTDMAHVTNCIATLKSPVPGHIKGVIKTASNCTIWAAQQIGELFEIDPATLVTAAIEMTKLKNDISAIMATEFGMSRDNDYDEAKEVLRQAAS